jgi:CxxC motif-containing protein (DUF1111 family)
MILTLAANPVRGEVPTRLAEDAGRVAQVTAPTADFTQAEPFEVMQGGGTTHRKRLNADAFSQASANMSFAREADFKIGNGFFKRQWVTAPASTEAADGLGPLFNARGCQNCHIKDGRGHPPQEGGPHSAESLLVRLAIPARTAEQQAARTEGRAKVTPDPVYGTQLQDLAIPGHIGEGLPMVTYTPLPVTLADGTVVALRKPNWEVASWGYGAPDPDIHLSPRVAPPMLGMGLLEAIPEAELLAHADPEDRDGDGISGRANRVRDVNGEWAMGRFGWKAGMPTVREQSAGAFAGDIGINTPLFPAAWGDCTAAQTACRAAPTGNTPRYDDLEAPAKVLDLVTFYSRNLALPPRRDVDDAQVLRGKQVFYQAGCVACHVPKFVTARLEDQPEQSFQLIWPYSDVLLHDMGPGLADGLEEGVATGQEWRTPPLWGIGLVPTVNGDTGFLHDGRARTVLEAILWHGGEGQAARDAVIGLPADDRAALLRFIDSL